MRCLIVDDHPMTMDGTALALSTVDPDMTILKAHSLKEAFELIAQTGDVNLVLLDLELSDSSGLSTLQTFKQWCEEHDVNARVVILSAHCEPALVRNVVNNFATGFILKATTQAIFKQAISLTIAGGVYIPDVALREMSPAPGNRRYVSEKLDVISLTEREEEVAALLIQGFTYKKIAREMERKSGRSISEHTIRVHVSNIAWKLGVTENAKAGVMAEISRRGLRFPLSR